MPDDRCGPPGALKMSESQDFEAKLVEHLPFIRRTAAKLCQRHGLAPDDTDEFVSWTTAKLVENDYAALRKFRGESSITTYLTVVISMHYRDYRVAELGRWRPSAEAKRQGADAIALEELVYRDGYGVTEAVSILRTRGKTTRPDRELYAVFATLPIRHRGRPRAVRGDAPWSETPADESADARIVAEEMSAQRTRMSEGLERALAELAPEDALIVRLHFFENVKIAAIARSLGLEQKPLYRRLERILSRLRGELAASGISRERVAELLEDAEK
ncbi:MAG TPA: sigma-70 family RNA polymerase sigma factor [Longimicrobium sp.]|nr:sigma-70 family RNA polymerase sigma factor [Longimicrobium sp.]